MMTPKLDWLPGILRSTDFWTGAAIAWLLARMITEFDPALFVLLSPITLLAAVVVIIRSVECIRSGFGQD